MNAVTLWLLLSSLWLIVYIRAYKRKKTHIIIKRVSSPLTTVFRGRRGEAGSQGCIFPIVSSECLLNCHYNHENILERANNFHYCVLKAVGIKILAKYRRILILRTLGV